MRTKLIAAAAVAVSISLGSMACSASTQAAATSGSGHGRPKHASARELRARRSAALAARPALPRAADRPFGTGCAQLPRTGGAGNRRGLPRLPVATAMGQVPLLSELTRAIRLAGLTRMLDTAPALTIFAPDNAAFQQLGPGNLQALFTTRSDLAPVLKFQIVAGRVRPAQLARQQVLTTIAGTKIYPARAAPSYFVNNAWISCGNLRTANATVYIVNQVLLPGT
jgi:uncharacterized surface protein with fasciclin (FAS1) repeats